MLTNHSGRCRGRICLLLATLLLVGASTRGKTSTDPPPLEAYLAPPYGELAAGLRPLFESAPTELPVLDTGQAVLFHAVGNTEIKIVFSKEEARIRVVQPTEEHVVELDTREGRFGLVSDEVGLTHTAGAGALALSHQAQTMGVLAGGGDLEYTGQSIGLRQVRGDAGLKSQDAGSDAQVMSQHGGDGAVAGEVAVSQSQGEGGANPISDEKSLDQTVGQGQTKWVADAVSVTQASGEGGTQATQRGHLVVEKRGKGGAATAAREASPVSLEKMKVDFQMAAGRNWGEGYVQQFGSLDSERFRSLLQWYRDHGDLPPLWLVHYLDLVDDEEFVAFDGYYDEEGNRLGLDDSEFEEILEEVEAYEKLDGSEDAGLIDYIVGHMSYQCALEEGGLDESGPEVKLALTLEPEGKRELYHGHGALLKMAVTNTGPRRLCNALVLVSLPDHTEYVPIEGRKGMGFYQKYNVAERTLRLKLFNPLDPGQTFRKQVVLHLDPWQLPDGDPS